MSSRPPVKPGFSSAYVSVSVMFKYGSYVAATTHMLEVELGLLSNGGIRVERRLDPVPQAGNVHGGEWLTESASRIGGGLLYVADDVPRAGAVRKGRWGLG